MDHLDKIAPALEALVDADELAGAATLVWRDGEVIQHAAVGWRDMATAQLVERDTLFRIASMTKPITSVAALMLVEEGRMALDDPIVRWAPEFADMRVLRSPDGLLDDTTPAERPITVGDLLTHRAGFTYADFHTGPIAHAYAEALGGDIDSPCSPDAWIEALARLPLIDQPGAAFHYGRSTDLLGFLIARIEEAPLEDVLRARLFDPLGMADTGFTVPPSKRSRRAASHGFDEAGSLTVLPAPPAGAAVDERPGDMTYVSGGQGLWSTLDDYLAFATLFVNGGMANGVQLLKPETLRQMTTNWLTAPQRAGSDMLGMPIFATGHGFGLGVAVVVEPDQAPSTPCGGGRGAVGWPGAYGGWWRADPTDRTVMIFLTHNMVRLDQLAEGIGFGVYGAIDTFQQLASTLP
ncbi:MAG: serine hydrolase domain-containing protein [Rhodothermales bacterium]